jgi:hypothetical protein
MAGRRLPPERVRLVLDHLAAGLNPNRAARAAGVSVAFAYGLHHKMGGVYRPPGVTYSARYLDREERYEIARLRELGLPVRQVAARLGRSPSTVSRELARNADPRGGLPGEVLVRCCSSLYEAVTGPAAVFHLNVVPDVPPISPATQNWLVVPGWGAAAL